MNISKQEKQGLSTSHSRDHSKGILLISKKNKFIGQVVLKNKMNTIGKDKHSDIILAGLRISKKHAILTYTNESWSIMDNASMTGTYVNNERIIEYDNLRASDAIRIQDYTLVMADQAKRQLSHAKSQPSKAEYKQQLSPAVTTTTVRPEKIQDVVITATPEQNQWREKLHQDVIATFDLRRQNIRDFSDDQLRIATRDIAQEIISQWRTDLPDHISKKNLAQSVIDDIVGLGPLEVLLNDETISEIMVNAADEIFIEKSGQIEKSNLTFANDNAVLAVIDRIITPLGRRIDQSSPMVDARLKDGSRVNAIIPPLAIKGPCITIRKFPAQRLEMRDLVDFDSLSSKMAAFFTIAVGYGKNILVSGGTGTGKTTLLNVLSNQIPHHERIITIEDAAELQLNQPDLVALESKPANIEGTGAIQIRDLVKNALRMRPNRIVVGECRGAEALDMLQAMNTGHDGSLTTLHANTPRDALSRLEVMVMMAGMDIPVQAIREQISSAVHIIVQQTRFPCGSRKITHVTEVVGMEAGTIQLQDIFRYRRQGIMNNGKIQGQFLATGFIPTFYEDLISFGHQLDTSLYATTNAEVSR